VILLLLACAAHESWLDEPCAAEFVSDPVDKGVRTMSTQLPDASGALSLHVQLRWPERAPGEAERWPVSVVLQGGWNQQGTPVDTSTTRLDVSEDLVEIHLDLPGNGLSGGENDRRGADSRAAVATALAWAAGRVEDAGSCTPARRTFAADPDDLYVVGTSNGGNLAAATLADASLDLPPLHGLVLWETPAGPQFVNVELGTDPTVYEAGTCALDADSAIRCAYPASRLAWSPDPPVDPCFDLDDNGRCGDADVTIHSTEDPVSGLRFLSPWVTADLAAAGAPLDGFADPVTSDTWWSVRDAARAAPALVAAQPDLPVLLLASEEDHIQRLVDHPHVFGLGEALQAAGAAWTRLNPGSTWLGDGPDNAPDAPLRLGEGATGLLTEDEETPLSEALSAAVHELSERQSTGDWQTP
jgi:alpha-beta hydrolase superfamily lysophospholipase